MLLLLNLGVLVDGPLLLLKLIFSVDDMFLLLKLIVLVDGPLLLLKLIVSVDDMFLLLKLIILVVVSVRCCIFSW